VGKEIVPQPLEVALSHDSLRVHGHYLPAHLGIHMGVVPRMAADLGGLNEEEAD
jgi:hypothetical protein